MVSRKTAHGRFAFTMIELIFAIVVMSIAVMSLPMMAQIASEGIEENIVQEAIFAASAELMGATSYYWDANSMQDNNLSNLERVIDIGAVPCNADRLRPGHINQPYHRRCLETNTTDPFDNPGGFPNLNDAQHINQLMFTDNITNAVGYKEAYNSTVNVVMTDDVKEITIEVTNSDGDTITRLRTYSANIGEIDFYKRRFF